MNTDDDKKIIMLTDILENKVRKEKELEYYQEQLEKLKQRMFFIRKDIDVTNLIINMIKQETLVDLVKIAEDKLLLDVNKED